ncbi:MAG: histidinol dehydrogenase, partial [Deltaproteobacteria bacterium]|nr:histidinol dehydrogenase [Deltaproteobacteria bacterium]
AGVSSIFKVGGAQAVAALAYGTASVPKVDKIYGPGNAYVTCAKSLVSQDPRGAASDLPAGPSEVLVVADARANAEFIAADLLSQAEHGRDSQVVLVTTCESIAAATLRALEVQLAQLSRRDIAIESLAKSLIIVVGSTDEAMDVANAYAPEHLILQIEDAGRWVSRVKHAGSIFVGPWSPESVGDYASGTNHVLPTYGLARSHGGLSIESFMKSMTVQELSPSGLRDIGPTVETLATMEGLDAHAKAVSVRLRALRSGDELTQRGVQLL